MLDQDDAVTTYSAAAEYRVDPLPRTHLTLGYSHHWFEQPGAQHQGNQLMVGVAYDLTSTLQAFGSYAQKVRFATIDQLFNPQQGNSLLRPEQSENYEGGIIWAFSPSGSATVSGFHNNVKNFILNNPITQSFFNEDIVVAGAQVIASYSPFPGLTFRPGYTYLDVRDPVTGLPTDYRPRHVVNFQVAYVPAATWLVSADLQYVADQSVGSKSNAATRFEVGDYTIVNARIQKSFPELALDCYVRGTNLLDERYIYSVGFPAAGRTIYAGLEYHF
ncbi:TonB-dependent receptor domain-containing protein [Methylobacterium sp. P31]